MHSIQSKSILFQVLLQRSVFLSLHFILNTFICESKSHRAILSGEHESNFINYNILLSTSIRCHFCSKSSISKVINYLANAQIIYDSDIIISQISINNQNQIKMLSSNQSG